MLLPHKVPENPEAQMQIKLPKVLKQVAPFRQGEAKHSLMSLPHTRPVNPVWQVQEKEVTKFSHVP